MFALILDGMERLFVIRSRYSLFNNIECKKRNIVNARNDFKASSCRFFTMLLHLTIYMYYSGVSSISLLARKLRTNG